MEKQEVFIKNMVCRRCIMSVGEAFRACGVEPLHVGLGRVELARALTQAESEAVRARLASYGFEVLDDRRSRLVEQIRVGVIEYVRHDAGAQGFTRLSDYLSDKCRREYSLLSKIFAEERGMTIERYCILQKVERAKELLSYGELTVSEIADSLRYSSVAHLSAQFKAVTGMSPTEFRRRGGQLLTPLDEV